MGEEAESAELMDGRRRQPVGALGRDGLGGVGASGGELDGQQEVSGM